MHVLVYYPSDITVWQFNRSSTNILKYYQSFFFQVFTTFANICNIYDISTFAKFRHFDILTFQHFDICDIHGICDISDISLHRLWYLRYLWRYLRYLRIIMYRIINVEEWKYIIGRSQISCYLLKLTDYILFLLCWM